ncbi:HpcH/HpaI aldolase/citrate lyase family protein [Novosphingobium pentaromativorans]|uniref:Citrate lyase subunit beta n=1 Tax=Novosphingobium pentaromativorans US6-1 TaxID=1088721 RepID=G6EFW2_9SPHN|nr:CoA ester lyase [Novosphingobium pentaromativorans]AIT81781.1 citrate lyase [Novosphingobium pentaromativorans US6-1]EHJ59651.1 citrate lyase subunit beta [Novosphingobium pentaromativorans US6-1]
MKLRSLLFVPADRPERFAKAAASGADALILDLEDSVAPEKKQAGREAIAAWLAGERKAPTFVRVNPLDGDVTTDDLGAVLPGKPDGIVLPKAEGAASVRRLAAMMAQVSTGQGALPPVLPIATETPAAVFQLGTYGEVGSQLAGLTWGAEDLPAAIGAATSREEDGSYTAPYEMVRSLCLFGAHAAQVPAIETVFPRIDAIDELTAYVARARRDGFTGMMAIHPSQVETINRGFTPSEAELADARAIVEAFAANPGVGALKLDGKMIDRPHQVQARRILDLS